jgi:uncharacterized iron-regulated membrane protein
MHFILAITVSLAGVVAVLAGNTTCLQTNITWWNAAGGESPCKSRDVAQQSAPLRKFVAAIRSRVPTIDANMQSGLYVTFSFSNTCGC